MNTVIGIEENKSPSFYSTQDDNLAIYPIPPTVVFKVNSDLEIERMEGYDLMGKLRTTSLRKTLSVNYPLSMTTTLELLKPNGIYLLKLSRRTKR